MDKDYMIFYNILLPVYLQDHPLKALLGLHFRSTWLKCRPALSCRLMYNFFSIENR
jgi:hypothetical protein